MSSIMTSEERKARHSFDDLYSLADKFIQKWNPCQIEIKNGVATCISSRTRPSFTKPRVLCCTGCEYHSATKGCTAEKPLTCKLWLCDEVKLPKEAWRKYDNLLDLFRKTNFRVHRGDKETSIAHWRSMFD